MGRHRSRTAADMLDRVGGFVTDYRGLDRDSPRPLLKEHLSWADLVVSLDKNGHKRLPDALKWSVPDEYGFCDPGLEIRLSGLIENIKEYKLYQS